MGRPNLSRKAKFLGANGDKGRNVFKVQLTPSRIGNYTMVDTQSALCDYDTYLHCI